ncbi:hypothetical protein BpHYR1_029975 [Brachionus plicatilis]|uniref:Uncharacterized protein n=1 Tax=Brachionus plicatilis TaxID=10195 RepID=A0A3M7Q4U1_BRAPC|nr:hypothetical protein BpHYR1_029975 [Brachionus plicatilis]
MFELRFMTFNKSSVLLNVENDIRKSLNDFSFYLVKSDLNQNIVRKLTELSKSKNLKKAIRSKRFCMKFHDAMINDIYFFIQQNIC